MTTNIHFYIWHKDGEFIWRVYDYRYANEALWEIAVPLGPLGILWGDIYLDENMTVKILYITIFCQDGQVSWNAQ